MKGQSPDAHVFWCGLWILSITATMCWHSFVQELLSPKFSRSWRQGKRSWNTPVGKHCRKRSLPHPSHELFLIASDRLPCFWNRKRSWEWNTNCCTSAFLEGPDNRRQHSYGMVAGWNPLGEQSVESNESSTSSASSKLIQWHQGWRTWGLSRIKDADYKKQMKHE